MSTQPPQIEYAKPLPWHRDRKVQRRIAFGLMIFGCIVAAILFGPTLFRHLQLMYLQHQCLTFQHPPNQIVHESGKKSVIASCWIDFYEVFSPPGTLSNGTVLVHEMRNTAGEKRLVAVDFIKTSGFSARVYRPGSLVRPVKELSSQTHYLFMDVDGPPSPALTKKERSFAIGAGTVDPADPSHFTFDVRINETSFIVDGWLRMDDTVSMSAKIAPLPEMQPTAPPPASRE